jgi:predicted metal-dependent phosphoesterase TrpH
MSAPTWTVELHAHTIYSKDSLLKLDRIAGLCQAKSIDRLAITDHNTVTAGLQLARLLPMLIIPGIEVMTTQGELLAWHIREPVPHDLSPAETIARLKDQRAVIGVAHPFDRHRKGAWREEDLLAIVDEIEVVEVFNARCLNNEDNAKALAFAQEHDKLMSSGSDAHTADEYGRAPMRIPAFNNNADGLRQALATGQPGDTLSSPSVHFSSTWAKWVKRLKLVRRPE